MLQANPSHNEANTGNSIVPINPNAIRVACSSCNLRELCMPLGLTHDELGCQPIPQR